MATNIVDSIVYEEYEQEMICELCDEPYVIKGRIHTSLSGTGICHLCPDCRELAAWKVTSLDAKNNEVINVYPIDYYIIPGKSAVEIVKPDHKLKFGQTEANDLIGVNFFVGARRERVLNLSRQELRKLKELL